MRFLLVRHGESEGNIDESQYIKKGDQNIGLTQTGWKQAISAGRFLKDFYLRTETAEWPYIFLSPYQRTRETTSGLLRGLDGFLPTLPKLREDTRLTEKFFGAASALHFLENKKVSPEIKAALSELFKAVYRGDPFSTRGLFGSSFKDVVNDVKSFMDGTLDRDVQEGQQDFLIVTHGAVIQAFLLAWNHLQINDKSKIGNPDNCDVICIEGVKKKWEITKIYSGKDQVAVNQPMLEGLKPFSIENLPPVPLFK